MGPIGFKELLVILVVVLLIFGAKKLKTIGSDLGSAVRGFKKSMNEGDTEESVKQLKADAEFSEAAKSQNAEKSETQGLRAVGALARPFDTDRPPRGGASHVRGWISPNCC